MPNICLYFQVHQPYRLVEYSFFQIGNNHFYENAILNKLVLDKVSNNCYEKANELIGKLIEKYPHKFKVTYSISGTALVQFENHRPDIIDSFQKLNKTGNVEFLAETFYHSLAFNYNKEEFEFQVQKHSKAIEKFFKQKPTVFRNTELIYNNDLAIEIEKLGFRGIITEGLPHILKRKNQYQLFLPKDTKKIKAILRDHNLSDDIAYRFSDKNWKQYPLTPKKFLQSMSKIKDNAETINIFIDYETFGEHHDEESGILKFFEKLITEICENELYSFKTPSELIQNIETNQILDCPEYISWADTEKDLSAWIGNSMQYEALAKIYSFKDKVWAIDDEEMLETWRKLQTSDHFYYMSTKQSTDGEVHNYFSPFNSPYDAYIYYMNILSDFELTLKKIIKSKK
ncbi:MAG: glycoside hydrolase family 57 protein [Bacteroidota bacterium]|nr:glycoside hydrolase family 57 protein [Bacteroidota bacterium]